MPWSEILDNPSSILTASSVLEEPCLDAQRPFLQIAPLRNPIPSFRRVPTPLEPATSRLGESGTAKPMRLPPRNPPSKLPTLEYFLEAARRDNRHLYASGFTSSDQSSSSLLPAFISPSTLENLSDPFLSDTGPRKRRRVDTTADSFGDSLQLPIPKAQQEIPKLRPFGPVPTVNKLREPPPNAALFPPIEAHRRPNILNLLEEVAPVSSEQPAVERRAQRIEDLIDSTDQNEEISLEPFTIPELTLPSQPVEEIPAIPLPEEEFEKTTSTKSPEKSKKPKKKLRKWTEQETHDLMVGVVRCGAGNWTAILSQPDLKFNDRNAGNLKDRFRVCCPWAYENGAVAGNLQAQLAESMNNPDSQMTKKILLPDPRTSKTSSDYNRGRLSADLSAANGTQTSEPSQNQPRSKPKRSSGLNGGQELLDKSKSTLVSLGLRDPIAVKASRRHRRNFTAAEDEALLKGYAVHGFQWTLIRQDKHLNLMHRKATDLRDRFRTKFPQVYREGGPATSQNTNNMDKDRRPSLILPTQGPPALGDAILDSQLANTNGTAIPIDPVMSPPAPPSNLPEPLNVPFTPVFSFPVEDLGLDENSCSLRWHDNNVSLPSNWDF